MVKSNKMLTFNQNISEHLNLIGIYLMFSTTILFIIIFYTAFFNESYSVLVTVNDYKEANFEAFVLAPTVFIFSLITIFNMTKEYIKRKEKI